MDCIKSFSKWQKLSIANTEVALVSWPVDDFEAVNFGLFNELVAPVVFESVDLKILTEAPL